MDKLILCLGNSYKHRGRCIAGIEITINAGRLIVKKSTYGIPVWIRPISHSVAGEIPLRDAQGIKILSVVKIYNAQYAGNASHSEDYYYEKLQLVQTLNPSDDFLKECIDSWHECIFGNKGRALTPEAFNSGDYSLMLIRTEESEIYLDTRYSPKPRIKFAYKGINYDFPIIDPDYLNRLKTDSSLYKTGYDALYIVVSLGVEHEGWHSKLAATIISPAKSNITETVSVPNSFSYNAVSKPVITSSNRNSTSSLRTKVTSETLTPTLHKALNTNIEFKRTLSEVDVKKLSSLDKSVTSKPQSKSNSGGCYVATTVYGSYNCPEVWTLRRYRDYKLYQTLYGRIFIHIYYAISPLLVKWFGNTKWFRKIWKKLLDRFVYSLQRRGFQSTPYKDME